MTTNSPVPIARRSIFLGGLWLMLRRPGAVIWAYLFNLGIALVFALRLHAQLASLLDHSMAAERLNSAFDLGTLFAAFQRLGRHAPDSGAANLLSLPVWLLAYFLLVPGSLFCYQAKLPARLGTMLSAGLCFFWRFVRITLLTLLASGIILGPLLAVWNAWSTHVEDRVVGVAAYWHELPLLLVILLIAAILRLYFDLVEAYTVQLDGQYRPNGKPDRRIRRALKPALKTLGRNWLRALVTFAVLAALGAAAVFVMGDLALHTLAMPRVWPTFLLIQAGLLINLAMRFWQRGAETVLVVDNPIAWVPQLDPGRAVQPGCTGHLYPHELIVVEQSQRLQLRPGPAAEPVVMPAPVYQRQPVVVTDPLPPPEPPVPPLAKSDPELIHRPPPPSVIE